MNRESLKLDYDNAYRKGVKLLESKKYYDNKVGLFILIGVQTGLRSKDLLKLNKNQIEFRNNGAVVNYTAHKTGKDGQAFVDTKISDAIQSCKSDDIFFNELMAVPFTHTWINRRLKTVFASDYTNAMKQGKTLGVHSLRKTSGSYIYNKYGVETARELLQHTGYEVTVRYLKEDKNTHLNKLEKLFA